MNIADIIRVYGTADNIGLELELNDGRWVCNLPPDLVDGQYAVQLFAVRGNGSVGMWTGVLYVANGIACLHLKQEKYSLWLNRDRIALSLNGEKNPIKLLHQRKVNISLLPVRFRINLLKECCCNG